MPTRTSKIQKTCTEMRTESTDRRANEDMDGIREHGCSGISFFNTKTFVMDCHGIRLDF
jgi:hypothetical protein